MCPTYTANMYAYYYISVLVTYTIIPDHPVRILTQNMRLIIKNEKEKNLYKPNRPRKCAAFIELISAVGLLSYRNDFYKKQILTARVPSPEFTHELKPEAGA